MEAPGDRVRAAAAQLQQTPNNLEYAYELIGELVYYIQVQHARCRISAETPTPQQ